MMSTAFLASAFVPAFCEEAIRSSYLYYLADKGRRRLAVISIVAVFVVGEAIYDVSLYSAAKGEVGVALATSLLIVALLSGAALHVILTLGTAHRQQYGRSARLTFAGALALHTGFNLITIAGVHHVLSRETANLAISLNGF